MLAPGPAVVVGGASGIGASVADRLRAEGNDVVVWDVARPHDIRCDVRDPEQIDRAAAVSLERLGVPSTVTVSAGIGHGDLLLEAEAEDWDRVMATNARGAWLVMRAFARVMSESEGGSMVAVSSVSARLADRSMGLYCASKAALDMVVRVAAVEWAPLVRVNAVAPGVTHTPMLGGASLSGTWLAGVGQRTALGRLGRAEDIAEAVLAVHAMSWVTGQSIVCDGGLSLFSPIDPTGATGTTRPGTSSS
jgi:NAD(P)-dependent dehydrogenase (short-subunit alcohol dehydrogenase family)